MTEKPKDLIAALDAMEETLELRRAEPDALLPELATLLLGFPKDSFDRPRAHRMLGVVYGRMGKEDDAFNELHEARGLASSLSPPNYRELGNIAREMSALYEARGEDMRARDELIAALAFCAIGRNESELTRLIAKVAEGEFEAGRFDNSALFHGLLISGDGNFNVNQHTEQCARVGLIQSFNALGRHDEVQSLVKESHAALSEDDRRLRFLTQLEAARAFSGLDRHDEAEGAMLVAENFLPESGTAVEHAEFIQAVMELQEMRNGDSPVDSLERLIAQCTDENDVAREAVARRALADLLWKRGEEAAALEALARALHAALHGKLDVAGDLRAELLRRAGTARLVDLSDATHLLHGDKESERRFVRLRSLGHGNAGESVLAVALADGALVSLRTFDVSALDESQHVEALQSIKAEYSAATKIEDPRFAEIRDLILAPDGMLYSVQARPDGQTLREFYVSMAENSKGRLAELLADLTEVLDMLHGQGVIHRDLRPSHVVVTHDAQGRERLVLIELGMAPIPLLAGAEAAGVPPYVAPEQIAGEPGEAGADIYALGQMIAEVWGGQVPSRANLGRLWKRDGANQMPLAIADLVRAMTATDPARRAADLSAAAEVLRTHRDQAD